MSKSILKIRILLFSLLAIAILFLIYKAIIPFGHTTYTWKPCNKSILRVIGHISELKPDDRMEGECLNKIIGEPAYFNLRTPRTFDSAKVTLRYKSNRGPTASDAVGPRDLSIIELGLLADKQKNYILKPIENKILDELTWDKTESDGVSLFQKNKQFESIDEFLNNLPPKNEIAVYKYDLPLQTKIDNYTPSDTATAIEKPLRGPYQIYTYLENEKLDWEFEFYDLNLNEEVDSITVNLYHQNELIVTKNLESIPAGNNKKFKLQLSGLPDGFYKIAVVVSNEILTQQITTKQKIISFINKIWLHEAGNTDIITLITDSSEIFARTNNPANLQKILVGDRVLSIDQTYQQFSQVTTDDITIIRFAKDDLLIIGDGIFSFSAKNLANPSYKKIGRNTDVDEQKINYIITAYTPPVTQQDEWQVQTLEFDLRNAWKEEGDYGFIITSPGLLLEDEIEDWIEVGEIKVELEGKTLWEKIKEILR